MSKPRRILPGATYLVTRRCRDRRFLLRPDSQTTQAFYYCLSVAASHFDVGVVAFIANSNHWHGVVVDRRGNIIEFIHYFHLLLAKHQNDLRGRRENMWAAEKTSLVELLGAEDVIDKIAYVLANPIKDHLVEKVHSWPGASAIWALRGSRRIVSRRPWRFFDKRGRLPPMAHMTLVKPPAFEDLSDDDYGRLIEDALANRELMAAEDRKVRRLNVLGRSRVLRQHWDDRPRSTETRRHRLSSVACRNRWARCERLLADRRWLSEYYNARSRWLGGEANVVFPPGTYWLRKYAGVICDGPTGADGSRPPCGAPAPSRPVPSSCSPSI